MSVEFCTSISILSLTPNPNPLSLYSKPTSFPSLFSPFKHPQIRCAKRSQRTGKLRYPYEKKRLKQIQKQKLDVDNKCQGFWRLSKLGVDVDDDPGKDFLGVSHAHLQQIAKVLEFPVPSMLPVEAFTVVRRTWREERNGEKRRTSHGHGHVFSGSKKRRGGERKGKEEREREKEKEKGKEER